MPFWIVEGVLFADRGQLYHTPTCTLSYYILPFGHKMTFCTSGALSVSKPALLSWIKSELSALKMLQTATTVHSKFLNLSLFLLVLMLIAWKLIQIKINWTITQGTIHARHLTNLCFFRYPHSPWLYNLFFLITFVILMNHCKACLWFFLFLDSFCPVLQKYYSNSF